MVRLIDADALNTYDVSPAYGMTVIGLTEEDIELAPTVDAIPVEWLEARYPIHDVYGTEAYFRKAYAIYEVIKEWHERKEE